MRNRRQVTHPLRVASGCEQCSIGDGLLGMTARTNDVTIKSGEIAAADEENATNIEPKLGNTRANLSVPQVRQGFLHLGRVCAARIHHTVLSRLDVKGAGL